MGQRGARGQLVATKQSQEFLGKGQQTFVKGLQRRFTRKCIAHEDHDEIDEIVGSHACAGEADPLDESAENACLREDLSKGCHFSHPIGPSTAAIQGWSGRSQKKASYWKGVLLFEKKMFWFLSPSGDTFFMLSPVSLDQLKISLHIPWAPLCQETKEKLSQKLLVLLWAIPVNQMSSPFNRHQPTFGHQTSSLRQPLLRRLTG